MKRISLARKLTDGVVSSLEMLETLARDQRLLAMALARVDDAQTREIGTDRPASRGDFARGAF